MDLVTDRTLEERLPNFDRHKGIASPRKRAEAVWYLPILTVKGQWVLGILTQCKTV
jgi:hypothetical protein